tara:strand:+ start:313 stop:1119 length:807 start_codon:yes stop_codon:yes gene_type:complete
MSATFGLSIVKTDTMSSEDFNTQPKHRGRKGATAGILIILLGVFWLLRKMGVYIPGWIFDWEMILIYIGLAIGINSGFRNNASWILIAIGGFFLLDDLYFIPFQVREYFWPIMVIVLGLVILLKPKKKGHCHGHERHHWKERYSNYEVYEENLKDSPHRLDSVAIFNGSKKDIVSKQFKGGETVTVFGGTELNLLRADFEGTIELENVVVFGGLKIIVPPNWEVRTNVVSILAGVEDKRTSAVQVVPDDKVLLITGVVVFGGIDIVSY